MSIIQPDAVAGKFYPDSPAQLRKQLQSLVDRATDSGSRHPKALIAPHAGYAFSGPVAGSAYAEVKAIADRISRVVLLGTCHVPGTDGLVATSAAGFSTPLGSVQVACVAALANLPQVSIDDNAHRLDHALQVQLPFLQFVLKDFQIVPLLVGKTDTRAVAEVLQRLWGVYETLVVISSDLSHYLDYQSAQRQDRETAELIVQLRGQSLDVSRACGFRAIAGLLEVARSKALAVRLVDLRNSGDQGAGRDRVVGYGAFVFCQGRQE